MSSTPAAVLRSEGVLPEGSGALASAAEPLLLELAGAGASLVSLTLDYGVPASPGQPITAEAWVDRGARTIVFVHGRVLDRGGATLATLSAVLRRGV
jgi:acyl-coenzyme A thioesterase PaaI-like protein